eukprot:CAMPEP_0119553224 /NCGR_PEP_ID=MMETSP1352-20130426/6007_1 /TAXON_ID=265584 /ORGANISM="Stauroneis constricta, Strain CCMP1120" /LENGTH=788 /DNA_ID=CAMNT_0007599581 /DNA_START=45 /DNA_END=2411 /DNA_ORIENTATION=+
MASSFSQNNDNNGGNGTAATTTEAAGTPRAEIPPLLMQAAQSAAQADGVTPPAHTMTPPQQHQQQQQTQNNTINININMNRQQNSNRITNNVAQLPTQQLNMGNAQIQNLMALQQAQNAMAARNQGAKPDRLPTSMSQPPVQQQQQRMSSNSGSVSSSKKKGPPLRRGKWTPEEEAYANRLIQEFKAGLLPLTDGTTLRTFLSKLLNCDPMRISKKFVGSNCIGKQVFRRRTADLNRLTPEQIQQSRAELSELERRFLDRVAQTNRVKSSGVGGGGAPTSVVAAPPSNPMVKGREAIMEAIGQQPNPPWLQPPMGYKHGNGAAMAASNLTGGGSSNNNNSRAAAAAAGRALLGNFNTANLNRKFSNNGAANANAMLMAELQRRASQQNMLSGLNTNSAQNLLAAASANSGSSAALAQFARSASAARLAGLGSGGNSISNLLKSGFSRDQLNQLAREKGLSSASLTGMIERQTSFDALMSLDFQSLQSIDNLANLIQTGGSVGNVPESGMKNAAFGNMTGGTSSTNNLSSRRLASAGRMESLLRSLSSQNVKNGGSSGAAAAANGLGNNATSNAVGDRPTSNANISNILQSMSSMPGSASMGNNSMNNLLNSTNAASAVSLANLLRENSSTGLTALRMQDGLNQRNNSVEDFLSLVAAGDIPHQDPSLLNMPLGQLQQNNGNGASGHNRNAVTANANAANNNALLQQHLLAQATGRSALANAIASGASFGNFQNNFGGGNSGNNSGLLNVDSTTALLASAAEQGSSSASLKRKLYDLEGSLNDQGQNKK